MLVLSRYKDETIMIGDDIQVTVVDIQDDRVRLGIVASPEIPIYRMEVYDAIQTERKDSGVNERKNMQLQHLIETGAEMLVLPRRKGESIMIGESIEITVVDILVGTRGDRVRVGVLTPPDVSVHRDEVYRAIKGI